MYKQTYIGRSGNFYEPGENAVWMDSSKIKDVCWITQGINAERLLFCFRIVILCASQALQNVYYNFDIFLYS